MAPSLYTRYIKELTGGGRMAIEHDWGFVHFQMPAWAPDCVVVDDLYVIPEKRLTGAGRELFEQVCEAGRKAGKSAVLAVIEVANVKAASAWKAQLAVGLVPVHAESGKVWMRKGLL